MCIILYKKLNLYAYVKYFNQQGIPMSNVTPIRPTLDNELLSLINDSESFLIIGKADSGIKMVSDLSTSEIYMMLEAVKLDLLAEYLGDE